MEKKHRLVWNGNSIRTNCRTCVYLCQCLCQKSQKSQGNDFKKKILALIALISIKRVKLSLQKIYTRSHVTLPKFNLDQESRQDPGRWLDMLILNELMIIVNRLIKQTEFRNMTISQSRINWHTDLCHR